MFWLIYGGIVCPWRTVRLYKSSRTVRCLSSLWMANITKHLLRTNTFLETLKGSCAILNSPDSTILFNNASIASWHINMGWGPSRIFRDATSRQGYVSACPDLMSICIKYLKVSTIFFTIFCIHRLTLQFATAHTPLVLAWSPSFCFPSFWLFCQTVLYMPRQSPQSRRSANS